LSSDGSPGNPAVPDAERTSAKQDPKRLTPWFEKLEGRVGVRGQEEMRKRLLKGMGRVLDKCKRIRPGFSSSWVAPSGPEEGTVVTEYPVDEAVVKVYDIPNRVEGLYHLTPFEYSLPTAEVDLIDGARAALLDIDPPEFAVLGHARDFVERRGLDLILKRAAEEGAVLGGDRYSEMSRAKQLTSVLVRYTAGYGIIEVLLKDPYIQDIFIDAPSGRNPVYVTFNHPMWAGAKCVTNISLSSADMESLLSRFRHESGRPFSESLPTLECDLDAFNTRVTVIGRPLSPDGTAMALRRHSTAPWTLARLIDARSMSTLAAGLISFLIDGRSTVLVAGGRGAGKTSLLGAIMLEFPQSQRILAIEDTRELPCQEMQALGYKVQSMLVMSSLGAGAGTAGTSADDALRVSLRLGESAIVVGEVRGTEARTLYEAMRTGTAGSSVLGTIHGASAKSVQERVVHDLGIPPRSFSATDIVIVAGLRRPLGSQHTVRRVVEISELDKEVLEFRPLLLYDEAKDRLVTTDHLKTSRKVGAIASAWGLDMKEALANIAVRREMRRAVVATSRERGDPSLLSAEWVARCNNAYWDAVESHGKDYEKVHEKWTAWFERATGAPTPVRRTPLSPETPDDAL
jgi:flagellar protein FlaI